MDLTQMFLFYAAFVEGAKPQFNVLFKFKWSNLNFNDTNIKGLKWTCVVHCFINFKEGLKHTTLIFIFRGCNGQFCLFDTK